MSRIEKALEKLARQKGSQEDEREKAEIKETLSSSLKTFDEQDQAADQRRLDPLLQAFHQPFSLMAEQFKTLRTHIQRLKSKHKHNVFLVTSTIGKEGKSMVSLNLAISFAQGFNEEILLVECDFRKPRLSSMLGLPEVGGLVQYLQDKSAANGLIKPTGIERLALLPAGEPPPFPAELLSSSRLDSLLHELKRSDPNRVVLIDSPPMMPVTDAAILAPKVDGIILVVQAHKTQRDAIEKALSSLDGAPLVGVVLNRVPLAETLSYFPKYYYGSDYGPAVYSDGPGA